MSVAVPWTVNLRLAPQVPDALGGAARPGMEAGTDEQPVERRHAGLALRSDRRQRHVLDPLELRDDLLRRQRPLRAGSSPCGNSCSRGSDRAAVAATGGLRRSRAPA